jgi:hypothetical protein
MFNRKILKPKPMYKEVKASERLPERIGKNIISKNYSCIDKDNNPRICYYDYDEDRWHDAINGHRYNIVFWLEKTPQQNAEEYMKSIGIEVDKIKGLLIPITTKENESEISLIELMENYAQSVGVISEEEIHEAAQDYNRDNNGGGQSFQDGVKWYQSKYTQPQPKEEEKCKDTFIMKKIIIPKED